MMESDFRTELVQIMATERNERCQVSVAKAVVEIESLEVDKNPISRRGGREADVTSSFPR